jgi:hypothetical protein
MSYTKRTGGAKEFHYTKEDIKRIESEDTESTREFKKALYAWKNKERNSQKKIKRSPSNYQNKEKHKVNIVDKPKKINHNQTEEFNLNKHESPSSVKFKQIWKNVKYRTRKVYRKIKPHHYYDYKRLIKNTLILLVIGILMSIVYSNLDQLNSISLIFFKLGSCLLLLGLFLGAKFLWRTYKNLKFLLKIQRKWIKIGLWAILLIILIFAYQQREDILNPTINQYQEMDWKIFYPVTFSFDEAKYELSEVTDEITEETSDFFEEDIDFTINPKNIMLSYFYLGNGNNLEYTVYGELNDYLKDLPRSMSYYYSAPSDKDFIMRNLDNKQQKEYLDPLVEEIKSKTTNKDDQARIAISLVQQIPYDYDGLYNGDIKGKYPYEVLYTQSGVCSEKVQLMVYLLKELGFGTAILRFDMNNHDAAGIKCPPEFDYEDSGYCFVEATTPSIITDSNGDYVGTGKLSPNPQIIVISEGNSFDSVSEEYNDAKEWKRISEISGQVLDQGTYNKWQLLVKKYDIKIDY